MGIIIGSLGNGKRLGDRSDHTFRDRLRAAEVPLEAIDQLGGWSSISTIGSSYGQGYSIEHLKKYLDIISMY